MIRAAVISLVVMGGGAAVVADLNKPHRACATDAKFVALHQDECNRLNAASTSGGHGSGGHSGSSASGSSTGSSSSTSASSSSSSRGGFGSTGGSHGGSHGGGS